MHTDSVDDRNGLVILSRLSAVAVKQHEGGGLHLRLASSLSDASLELGGDLLVLVAPTNLMVVRHASAIKDRIIAARQAGGGRVRGGALEVLSGGKRRGDDDKEVELHHCEVTVVVEDDEVGSECKWYDCFECGVCGSD
jgi:hypothetical protein